MEKYSKGPDLLKNGIIWGIGDGEDVKIWEDPWIPRGYSSKPITPRRGILLSRVAELIHPGTGQWDENLVRDLFWEEDVPTILALPIHLNLQDIVAWHYDPKGIFSVKSAYRVWCDDQQRHSTVDRGAASFGKMEDEEKIWSGIWILNLPNRLKHFCWRFSHNSLALRVNQERRGIKSGIRCVMCNQLGEDGCHLFFKCKKVKELWRIAGLEDWRQKLQACGSALEVIMRILEAKEDTKTKPIFLLCNWWHERNSVMEGAQHRNPGDIAALTWKQTVEIQNVNKAIQPENKGIKRKSKWSRPQEGQLKINVDGAFSAEEKTGSWGYIIRDEHGQGIQSGWGSQQFSCSPLHMELRACMEGVKAAAELGIANIVLETDALQVMDGLREENLRLSVLGGVFYELKVMMHERFYFFPCQVPHVNVIVLLTN